MLNLLPSFLPDFFGGLAVNFYSAICGMMGGLLLGFAFTLLRLAGGVGGALASGVVGLFRATPIFVVMFFLVNVLPSTLSVGTFSVVMSPWLAVVLALIIYGSAYIADNALEPIRDLRKGSYRLALLFIMSLVRMFFVMVLASGFGAAVGVIEATTVSVRAVESLPNVSDRLMLIGIVIAIFTITFQTIYRLTDFARQKLAARLTPV